MSERTEKAVQRYRDAAHAAHAVQSGVALEMNYLPEPTHPKHLRTGLNMAMSDHAGLVRLLIAKGILTEEEYLEAIADQAEVEKAVYEERMSERLGKKVTLA
jgi:hypothetical protein